MNLLFSILILANQTTVDNSNNINEADLFIGFLLLLVISFILFFVMYDLITNYLRKRQQIKELFFKEKEAYRIKKLALSESYGYSGDTNQIVNQLLAKMNIYKEYFEDINLFKKVNHQNFLQELHFVYLDIDLFLKRIKNVDQYIEYSLLHHDLDHTDPIKNEAIVLKHFDLVEQLQQIEQYNQTVYTNLSYLNEELSDSLSDLYLKAKRTDQDDLKELEKNYGELKKQLDLNLPTVEVFQELYYSFQIEKQYAERLKLISESFGRQEYDLSSINSLRIDYERLLSLTKYHRECDHITANIRSLINEITNQKNNFSHTQFKDEYYLIKSEQFILLELTDYDSLIYVQTKLKNVLNKFKELRNKNKKYEKYKQSIDNICRYKSVNDRCKQELIRLLNTFKYEQLDEILDQYFYKY